MVLKLLQKLKKQNKLEAWLIIQTEKQQDVRGNS